MQRRTFRQRKCAPITLCFGSMRSMGQILDISVGGVRVRVPSSAPIGSIVTLHGFGFVVQAQVKWRENGHIGLAFLGDPAEGDLRRLLTTLTRLPLPPRGARMHGFTELAGLRPALPAAPLPP